MVICYSSNILPCRVTDVVNICKAFRKVAQNMVSAMHVRYYYHKSDYFTSVLKNLLSSLNAVNEINLLNSIF